MLNYDCIVFRSTFASLMQNKPYVIQQGGTSSGKTFQILMALFQLALQSEKSLVISVVAATLPMLKKGAIKDFNTILSLAGYNAKQNKTDNKYHIGESYIEFFAVDDSGKAKSGKRDILFINEANEIDWSIVYQLTLRSYQTKIFDYNPSAEFWLHDQFLPNRTPDEYLFKVTTYKDNPALSVETIREIESLPPDLFRIYGEGRTGQINGLIYTDWREVFEFPSSAKEIEYGLDFGFTNDPTTLIKRGKFDGGLVFEEVFFEQGMTTEDIHTALLAAKVSRNSLINADSSEPRLIAELQQKGWYIVGVTKGADSVRAGIMKLKTFQISITSKSVNMKKEIRRYKWREINGAVTNTPVDKDNHTMDSMRYACINITEDSGVLAYG